jgi:preprotein translocase subunit SecG
VVVIVIVVVVVVVVVVVLRTTHGSRGGGGRKDFILFSRKSKPNANAGRFLGNVPRLHWVYLK